MKKQYVAIPVVVLVVAVAGVIAWSSAGNKGQISDTRASTPVRLAAYQDYNGSYMSFRYASKYQVQKLPAADNNLELATLTANTVFEKKLAVSVAKAEDGTLNANSAYILRKSHPELYSAQTLTVDGAPATAYTKNDGLEETIFIPRGNKVAMFSFSTAGTVDNLSAEANELLASFTWKQ